MKKTNKSSKSKTKADRPAASLVSLLKTVVEQNKKILSLFSHGTVPAHPVQSGTLKKDKLGLTGNVDFLLNNPVFSGFTPQDASALVSECTEKTYEPGEVIFKEGEIGNSLYIVKSGEVKIYKTDVLGDLDIALLGTGQFFGEMAIVDNKPRSANVKTAKKAVLLKMTKENYYSFLKEHPAVAVKFMNIMMSILTNRLREANKKAFTR